MKANSNKEYQACQKEISNLKGEIDTREERLLVLMDELDGHQADHETELKKFTEDKKEKNNAIDTLRQRQVFLAGEIDRLDNEKPVFLREIDPRLKNKYERLHDNLGHLPATRVESGVCGGCGATLPPQLVVEIRENDKLLTCQACGRILIYYVN
jgi:predicted  nucleic acid-binding Zn-ribbon protein